MQTRLRGQYNGKWPITLVCVSRPLVTVITAIGLFYDSTRPVLFIFTFDTLQHKFNSFHTPRNSHFLKEKEKKTRYRVSRKFQYKQEECQFNVMRYCVFQNILLLVFTHCFQPKLKRKFAYGQNWIPWGLVWATKMRLALDHIGWSRTELRSSFPMSLTSSSSPRDKNRYGGIWLILQIRISYRQYTASQ